VSRWPCLRYRGAGGPEVIEAGELDVSDPGPGEVQVEVEAAGLNRADLLQRRGLYPAPPGATPDVPGLEFAGTVVARGPGATLWSEGAAVMAIVGGGAMARRVTLHERELLPVPAGLSRVEAAAIPEVFLTAWDAMVRQAGLRAGQAVLVHAAASGVGTAALQLARLAGARVVATTRRPAKLEALAALGLLEPADGLVVGDPPAFAAAVVERTGGGAHVVLDTVGGAYLEDNLRAAAPGGRIVLLATAGGGAARASLTTILGKRLTVIGSVMRSRPLEEKMALARQAAAELVPAFARGLLRPVIDRVYPMAALADAQARMEADDNVGKLVCAW
jgi:putative PIG3 family NAD(P)H quinone oxidoreductase